MIEENSWRTRLSNVVCAIRLFRNWPLFILKYIRAPEKPAAFDLRNGLRLTLRPGTSDFRIVREILVWGEYEPPGFEIGPDFTVVDIGAQIGVFTVNAGRKALRGRIISFEPHPDNFALLKQNIDANVLRRASPYNRAVADKAGTLTFFVSSFNTGGHSIMPSEGRDHSLKVEAIRLDDILRDEGVAEIDYMKIDCEGAEVQILRGLSDETLRRIRRIVMEVHAEVDTTDAGLAGWLRQRGFSVESDGNMVYARRSQG
ncbi:MAG: FkbM family methyltransferase [Kiritimatiellae bacterium]|nr:FkbM family methyltransferase [Kiritimatiellia bacterium]MCO5069132.1 FkbM family methyltransferase [Kiritimatiellia bacterium]